MSVRPPDRALFEGREYFVFGAVRRDPAAVEDDDPLGEVEQRGAVGDEEQRPVFREYFEVVAHTFFARGVHRRGRLVEQQQRGIFQDGAGDSHRLPLSAGEVGAALADLHVEALRVVPHDDVDAADLHRLEQRLVGDVWIAHYEVVAQRPVEEHHLLRHDADGAAQLRGVNLAAVGAVYEDRPLCRAEELEDKLEDGALAGADGADDGDLLSRPDCEIQRGERPALLFRV